MFLGPPDRYDEDMCWLIDIHGDFGLSLGGSSEPLGSLLGGSWVFLVHLGSSLAASWGAPGELLWVINVFNIRFVALYNVF